MAKRLDLGLPGTALAANLRQLRRRKDLTHAQLSERLYQGGCDIPVLGLSRIENGQRRVHADELVALALVLDVRLDQLLLPEEDEDQPDRRLSDIPGGFDGTRQELKEQLGLGMTYTAASAPKFTAEQVEQMHEWWLQAIEREEDHGDN